MPRSPILFGARDRSERMRRIGTARIAVALSVGVAPRLGALLFGAPREQLTPTAVLLGRLFAVRNATLGAWALALRDAESAEVRRFAQMNAAVDIADFVVALLLLRHRGLRRTAVMSGVLAVNATLAWFDLLGED